MAPRYDDDWIASLMDLDKRVGAASPEELLSGCSLKAGDTVVDLGCGPGLFSIAAANQVDDVDTGLPHESFAYFSIEPGTSVADGDAKAENDEAQLPRELCLLEHPSGPGNWR